MQVIVNERTVMEPVEQPDASPVSRRGRALVPVALGVVLILSGIAVSPWVVTRVAPSATKVTLTRSEFVFLATAAFALWGMGAALLVLRRRISGKQLLFAATPIVAMFLLLEFGLRAYQATKNALARRYDFSAKVGWVTPENEKWSRIVPGFGRVDFSTKHDGFREYGDVNTTRTKLFFIGDSFTHAYTVSDGKAYFNAVQRELKDVELFVYGCGGYGTLQEYMILDKYYDQIKPDIVILQLGSNDIVNNSYELESKSFLNNKHITRPYLRDGKIVYLYPRQDYGPLYNLIEHSEVLQFFDVRLGILKTQISGTIESSLSTTSPLVMESAGIMDEVFGWMRKRAGETPVCVFSNDKKFYAGADYVGNTYEKLCEKHRFYWIPGVPETIERAQAQGLKVTGAPKDPFHWNELGHQLVGQTIALWMRQRKELWEGRR